MTEVKNSSLDLLSRQMSGSIRKEERDVEGPSGFKTMLKSKNQKKDSGKSETAESGDKKDTETSDAAASAVAAGMLEAQKPADNSKMTGQELIRSMLSDDTKTGGIQAVASGDGEKAQKIDPFQSMNQIRLQKLTGNAEGMKQSESGRTAVLPDGREEIPDAGLMDKLVMPVKGNQKEAQGKGILTQDKTAGPVTDLENEKNILAEQLLRKASAKALNQTEEEQVIPGGKTEEKQAPVKEEKKPENSMEIFQEKSHEPNQALHIQTNQDDISYTTVNAENLKDLEAKLSEQILNHIHAGKRDLEVQLEPHNLGKIQIKVSYEDNQVSVSVLCTESKTLKLLSQSAGDLGTILENNLERPIHIIVDKHESDYLNNQQDQGGRQEQRGQNQENRQEENREDFIQKLRLGIFETDSSDDIYTNYR